MFSSPFHEVILQRNLKFQLILQGLSLLISFISFNFSPIMQWNPILIPIFSSFDPLGGVYPRNLVVI